MAIYINIKDCKGQVETIDEFDKKSEAREAMRSYHQVYKGMNYELYMSSRSTKEWREDNGLKFSGSNN